MNRRWNWGAIAGRRHATRRAAVVWRFERVIATDPGFNVLFVPVVVPGRRPLPAGRFVAIGAEEAQRLSGHLRVMRLTDAEGSLVYVPDRPDAEAALQELVRRSEQIRDSAWPRRMYLSDGTEASIHVSCVGGARYASIWHPGLEFPVTLTVQAQLEAGEPVAVAQATADAMSILLAEIIGNRELRLSTGSDAPPGRSKPWRFIVAGTRAEGVHVVWIGLLGPDGRPLRMEHQDARSLLTEFVTHAGMTETRKEVDS